jgi:hypothetical protein
MKAGLVQAVVLAMQGPWATSANSQEGVTISGRNYTHPCLECGEAVAVKVPTKGNAVVLAPEESK